MITKVQYIREYSGLIKKFFFFIERLTNFVKATENLMNLVMIINNRCNEQLEKLENQKSGLTNKLLVAAL
jgi:hypothetical protein